MCDFDGVWRSRYFVGESISRTEVEVRMKMFRNGETVSR